jgi:acid-activated urea channel
MGWLGVCLIFVGIALFTNGIAAIIKMDGKTLAFVNLAAGLVIAGGNFISLDKVDFSDTMAYNNIAAGFLFGFTYLFIAANHLFKLDLRAFGYYSFFVVIFAIVSTVVCLENGLVPLACLWIAWAVLWLEGFLEFSCGIKAVGKAYPVLSMFEGIFAGFIPALMMLFGTWPT